MADADGDDAPTADGTDRADAGDEEARHDVLPLHAGTVGTDTADLERHVRSAVGDHQPGSVASPITLEAERRFHGRPLRPQGREVLAFGLFLGEREDGAAVDLGATHARHEDDQQEQHDAAPCAANGM